MPFPYRKGLKKGKPTKLSKTSPTKSIKKPYRKPTMSSSTPTKSITDYFPVEETVQKLPEIHLYTDGSTFDNGKISAKGGYSVFFGDGDSRNIGEPFFIFPITNNRCEIYACIQALQILARSLSAQKKHRVIIHTDSEYTINCMTKWLPGWKMRGWKKADRKAVENQDLLFWLDKLIHLYQVFMEVRFKHIRASHDTPEPKDKSSVEWKDWHGNNEADHLAKHGTNISVKLEKVTGQ